MHTMVSKNFIGLDVGVYNFNQDKYCKNIDLLKGTTWTKKFINMTTGALENNPSYSSAISSDFFEINPDIPYISNLTSSDRVRVYDKDYNYINVISAITGSYNITGIQSNVKYARIMNLYGDTNKWLKASTDIRLPNGLYNTISQINGVKYIKQQYSRVVLSGSEDWQTRGVSGIADGFIELQCSYTSSGEKFFTDYNNSKFKMTMLNDSVGFTTDYLDGINTDKAWISGRISGKGWIVYIPKTIATTVAEWTTYLASNNISFYAQLNEIKYIPYDTRELQYSNNVAKDTITIENGKVYYSKYIDKYIVNGIEDWVAQTNKINTSVFAMHNFSNILPFVSDSVSCCSIYCNLNKNGTDQSVADNVGDIEKIVVQKGIIFWAISKEKVPNFITQDFKDWLKINRPIMFYPTTKTKKIQIK